MRAKQQISRFFTTKQSPLRAIVKRMDTHGNVYTVPVGRRLTKPEAEKLAAHYEAKGHHQTYWAEEEISHHNNSPDHGNIATKHT